MNSQSSLELARNNEGRVNPSLDLLSEDAKVGNGSQFTLQMAQFNSIKFFIHTTKVIYIQFKR